MGQRLRLFSPVALESRELLRRELPGVERWLWYYVASVRNWLRDCGAQHCESICIYEGRLRAEGSYLYVHVCTCVHFGFIVLGTTLGALCMSAAKSFVCFFLKTDCLVAQASLDLWEVRIPHVESRSYRSKAPSFCLFAWCLLTFVIPTLTSLPQHFKGCFGSNFV